MTHVKHLGFELELKVKNLIEVCTILKPEYRELVIEHLAPIKVKRAVADHFGINV